jgi:hypothetical protein
MDHLAPIVELTARLLPSIQEERNIVSWLTFLQPSAATVRSGINARQSRSSERLNVFCDTHSVKSTWPYSASAAGRVGKELAGRR